MKKINLIFILFLTLIQNSFGQIQDTFYYDFGDNIGEYTQGFLQTLNDEAEDLVMEFPAEFRDSFRVYSTGFFLHNNEFQEGIPAEFNRAILKASIKTKYYLLIGREWETDKKNAVREYWVKINLPNSGKLFCIDQISPSFRNEISNEVRINIIKNQNGFVLSEISGMNRLKEIISSLINCCTANPLDPTANCTSCENCKSCSITERENDPIPYRATFEKLADKGFAIEIVSIVEDTENSLPSLQGNNSSGSRNLELLNATVDFFDKSNQDLDELIFEIKTSFQNSLSNDFDEDVTVNAHVFKYPRDCGDFEDRWTEYENDNSDYCLFLALINVNGKVGLVGTHFKVNKKNDYSQRTATPNEFNESLEGLQEVEEEADVCGNLILAYGNRFSDNVDAIIGNLVIDFSGNLEYNEEQKRLLRDYYEKQRIISQNNVNQAVDTWKIYYELEYQYLIQKGTWRYKAWAMARYHVCSDYVHCVFDFCGLVDPWGLVCDGANSLLYFMEGDVTNGVLTMGASIPVLGLGIGQSKIAGRVLKYTSVKVPISFSFKHYGNVVHFVGGYGKLKRVIKSTGFTNSFAGITRHWNDLNVEVHHLIPFEYFKAANTQLPIIKRMASSFGWHAGDPWMNGLIIPKKLPSNNVFLEGAVDVSDNLFHGNHPNYNSWVRTALEDIDAVTIDAQLSDRIQRLQDLLINHLEDAYSNSKSINNYFNTLPRFKMSDL